MQGVCTVARFQASPKESHVTVVKRIFKYIQGTLDYGLWYPRSDEFSLIAYTNANRVGCLDDKKSTSGAAFFLGDRLVAWHNKKQVYVSLSIAKVEYIVATSCCTQVLWMSQILLDMGIVISKPVSILFDNTSAINILKNLVMHSHTKHIAIKFHFLEKRFWLMKSAYSLLAHKIRWLIFLLSP